MRKIKIAQIGAEHDHASSAFGSLKKQSDIFDLVGYAIPEGETNVAPQAYEGYTPMTVEELLDTPGLEAVVIETSETNLTKYALMAAERGLAIQMDKPGGCELSDFEKLIANCREKNLVFQTGYMYRFNPEVKKLLKDIKEGKLGEIYSVETHMDCRHTPYKRQWLGKYPGGMMFFLGCHLIDLIYQIMGEPEEVIPMNMSTGFDGVTAEDYGFAVLKYKNGVSFAKTCAYEPGGFLRRQLVVCGSKGTVQLMPLEEYESLDKPGSMLVTRTRSVTDGLENWANDGVKSVCEAYDRYDNMMAAFASFVRGEAENPYTLDYELAVYKLVLRACGK